MLRPPNPCDNGVMIGNRAAEYERTCRECGYSWRLPRSLARYGIPGMFTTRGGACGTNFRLNSWQANSNTAVRSLGLCAQCGVTNYEQRPVVARAVAIGPIGVALPVSF
jgi:predicted nucleic-acid-binding Zn-ribbon protein